MAGMTRHLRRCEGEVSRLWKVFEEECSRNGGGGDVAVDDDAAAAASSLCTSATPLPDGRVRSEGRSHDGISFGDGNGDGPDEVQLDVQEPCGEASAEPHSREYVRASRESTAD